MENRLYRTALIFPVAAGAGLFLLFAMRPPGRSCDDLAVLTSAQHGYQTHLKLAGAVIALAVLALIWLLARRGRSLAQTTDAAHELISAASVACAGLAVLAGTTVSPALIGPFLLLGLVSTVFFVAPVATGAAYVAAVSSVRHVAHDVARERRFIRVTLVFYFLSLVLLLPGILAVLALRLSPICLGDRVLRTSVDHEAAEARPAR